MIFFLGVVEMSNQSPQSSWEENKKEKCMLIRMYRNWLRGPVFVSESPLDDLEAYTLIMLRRTLHFGDEVSWEHVPNAMKETKIKAMQTLLERLGHKVDVRQEQPSNYQVHTWFTRAHEAESSLGKVTILRCDEEDYE